MGSLRSDQSPFFTQFFSTPQCLPLCSLCSFSTWRLVSVFSFRKCSRRIIPLTHTLSALSFRSSEQLDVGSHRQILSVLVLFCLFSVCLLGLHSGTFVIHDFWHLYLLSVWQLSSFVVFLQRALFPFPGCPVPPNPLKIPPTDEFSDPVAPLSWISSVSEWRFPCPTPKVSGLTLSTAGFLPLCSNIWLHLKVKARKQLGEFHYFV